MFHQGFLGQSGHKFDFTLMPQRVRDGITLSERWIRATLLFFQLTFGSLSLSAHLADFYVTMVHDR